jgi:LPS export ABC transporter protein LptC
MHMAAILGRHYSFHAMRYAILRAFFVVSVLVSIAAALYFSYRVLRKTDFSVPALFRPSAGKRIVISMEGFRLVETEKGRVSWSVQARRADLLDSKEAQLREVEAVFNSPGGRTAALIGEQGTLDTVSGNASIRRGTREVRIVTSDGYLMTTDSLSWKARDRTIRTNDPFKVLGREIYMEGKGMTADVDLGEVSVDDNVKAILQE